MNSFSDLNLCPEIAKALQELGFTQPTQIQAQAIPMLMQEGRVDFHGQAQTGTGKTLAFGIPLLQKIDPTVQDLQALIVAPTRELVTQIVKSLSAVAVHQKLNIVPVYGGVSIMDQERALRRGAHIVVGTTGRLLDHMRRRTLKLGALKTLVLDEADLMLDMGFKEDIDEILAVVPETCSIWLFSATIKPGIQQLKEGHMRNPLSIRTQTVSSDVTTKNTKQYYIQLGQRDRLDGLLRVVDCAEDFYGIVFVPTKVAASEVSHILAKKGYSVGALHGDMNQHARNDMIKLFKDRQVKILIATDVASRGIDVVGLSHVVNYSLPKDHESYVHRIGRTGRAGKEGIAITFVSGQEMGKLRRLEQRLKTAITRMPIPSLDDLVDIRVNQALTNLKQQVTPVQTKHKAVTRLVEQLQAYSKDDLCNALSNMLNDRFFADIAERETIQVQTAYEAREPRGEGRSSRDRSDRYERSDRRSSGARDGNTRELMLNVGKQNGISKYDVLRFIIESNQLPKHELGKVRVIDRQTFFVVPAHRADPIMKALASKKLGGTKIQVSAAQQRA
jgi:ATP-dependent RNA helicase DeaD